jgi:hypothetical protein
MSFRTLLNTLLVPAVPSLNCKEGTENNQLNQGCSSGSLRSLSKEHRQARININKATPEPTVIKTMCKCGRYRLPFCSCGFNNYQSN